LRVGTLNNSIAEPYVESYDYLLSLERALLLLKEDNLINDCIASFDKILERLLKFQGNKIER